MTKRWDAAIVGEVYVDHIFFGLQNWPRCGEEAFAQNYLCEVGGGAAITACGTALLERRVATFGVIGVAQAEWIDRRLRSFGVETDGLNRVDTSSGITVSISVGDERTLFSHKGSNQLLSEYLLSPGMMEQLQQAEHIHFAAPLERHVAQSLLRALRSSGCSLSLDVGWQMEWFMKPENLQTCREVDYFLPNRKEAEHLTGQQHPREILRKFDEMGFSNAVVKLGAEGAATLVEGETLQVPSLKVQVVDTTGAGDAFDAGLIDAILNRAEPQEMLRRATLCGALSTRAAGALMGLVNRQELERTYYEQS